MSKLAGLVGVLIRVVLSPAVWHLVRRRQAARKLAWSDSDRLLLEASVDENARKLVNGVARLIDSVQR